MTVEHLAHVQPITTINVFYTFCSFKLTSFSVFTYSELLKKHTYKYMFVYYAYKSTYIEEIYELCKDISA